MSLYLSLRFQIFIIIIYNTYNFGWILVYSISKISDDWVINLWFILRLGFILHLDLKIKNYYQKQMP